MQANDPILIADRLCVSFGDFRAIAELSLAVLPNSIHSIIGPNGAGKTTLFNSLSGVRRPTSGRILFEGKNITSANSPTRVRLGMGRSFQVTTLFPNLSVQENLRLAIQARYGSEGWIFWRGTARRADIRDEVNQLVRDVGLAEKAADQVGSLSHGAQRSLEIGMALASRPRLVFLDEPLAGMGIDDVHRTKDLIASLRKRMAILLIEHNMSVVLDISDRVTVMSAGRKIAEGSANEIRSDPQVRSAYLGSAA